MRLRFDLVDVFTDRRFAGNQLAVVHGADDLTAQQCLEITREFNFSETTFPDSTVADGTTYRTRIFTPGGEVPFAGHPTLGTAWVLRSLGKLTSTEVTQVCTAGGIGVEFVGDLVELSATPRDLVGPLDADLVDSLLGDLGLGSSNLVGPARIAGCGLSFVHLFVTPEAVRQALPSVRSLSEYSERLTGRTRDRVEGINLVSVSGSAPSLTVHSRVFVPGLSVAEDPATGSAAVGLGMALVAAGQLPEGGRYDITQGVEMGRPSFLRGRVEVGSGSMATMCHVAGGVQHIGSGEIEIPPIDSQ